METKRPVTGQIQKIEYLKVFSSVSKLGVVSANESILEK